MIAATESCGQRINLCDVLGDGCNRFVYSRVAARLDDFKIGNAPVFLNPQFHQHVKFFARRSDRRWLHPLAVEPVMQHAAVPTELRLTAAAARMSTVAC